MTTNMRYSFSKDDPTFNKRLGRSEIGDSVRTYENRQIPSGNESMERSLVVPAIKDIKQERALHCIQRKISDTFQNSPSKDIYQHLSSNLEQIARGNSVNDQKRENNIVNLENTWNVIKRELSSEKRNNSTSPNNPLSAKFIQLTKPTSFSEKMDISTDYNQEQRTVFRCDNFKNVALRSIPHSKISLEINTIRTADRRPVGNKECTTPKEETRKGRNLSTSQKFSTPVKKTLDMGSNDSFALCKDINFSESFRLERGSTGKPGCNNNERFRHTESDQLKVQKRKNSDEVGFSNLHLALNQAKQEVASSRVIRENSHTRKKSGGSIERSYVCYPYNGTNKSNLKSPVRRENLSTSKTLGDANYDYMNTSPQKIMVNSQVLNLRRESTEENESTFWKSQTKISLDLRSSGRRQDFLVSQKEHRIQKQKPNDLSSSRRIETSPRNKNAFPIQSSTLRQDSEDQIRSSWNKPQQKLQFDKLKKQNSSGAPNITHNNGSKMGRFQFSQKAVEYAENNTINQNKKKN